MTELLKDDVLKSLDYEIEIMNDSVKLNKYKTWALIVALCGLFSLATSVWEKGGIDLQQVLFICTSFFMGGQILDQIFKLRKNDKPILRIYDSDPIKLGLPILPPLYGILIVLPMGVLFYLNRSVLPAWVANVGLAFYMIYLSFLLFSMLLKVGSGSPFSFTDPKPMPGFHDKSNFSRGMRAGMVDAHKKGFRIGNLVFYLINPLVPLILFIFLLQEIYIIEIGKPIYNLKFSAILYLTIILIGILITPPGLKSLPSLITLRRELVVDGISPRDAYLGLNLSQNGILIAPTIILAKNSALVLIESIKAEINESPDYIDSYNVLSEQQKMDHPLFKQLQSLNSLIANIGADIQTKVLSNPESDRILLSIYSELEEGFDLVNLTLNNGNTNMENTDS